MTRHRRWFAWLLAAVGLCPAAARADDPHFAAQFADGTYIADGRLTDWHNTTAQPKLNGQPLFDPQRPIRFLRNTEVALDREPEAFVEFFGGDRFVGRVTGFTTGEESFYRREHSQMLATTPLDVSLPETPRTNEFRLSARWAKRIVWQRRLDARYTPATLYYRDGREMAFRRVRFLPRGVFVLLDSGPIEVPIDQIAELHLPRLDPWQAYFEQLALLGDAGTRLVRLETDEGLRLTTSTARFRAHHWGDAGDANNWYRSVQPAWLDVPLAIPQRRIHTMRWNEAHDVPLSSIEPTSVEQKELIGGGWTARIDRSVRGTGLTAGGRESAWGIGMHATCRMTFPLPAAAKSFRSAVGLDKSVGRGGCARAEVYIGGTSVPPAFRSEHLVGAERRVETPAIALDSANDGKRELVLVADPAHADRPADADPFDIRDLVNWCEPCVELDRDALAREVAARAITLVPAWEGWSVQVEGGGLALADRWSERTYDREANRLRFVSDVSGKTPLVLSRKLRIENDHRYLMLCVEQADSEGKANEIAVTVDGEPYARFEVPAAAWNGAAPTPRLIPVESLRGREVSIEIAQSGGSEKNRVAWRRIALVAEPTSTRWTVVAPRTLNAAEGTALAAMPDGSILASGKNAPRDTYTIEFESKQRGITAIRLESLLDEAHPAGGPGRSGDGRFQLTEVRLSARPARAADAKQTSVPIAGVSADYYETKFEPALAIDGKANTAWSTGRGSGKPHAIVLALDADPTSPGGTIFTLDLEQHSGQQQTLGRFRVSASSDALPLEPQLPGRRIALRSETVEALAARRKMLFDDDPKFVQALVARNGKIAHDGSDRFTGGACLKLAAGIAENLAIADVSVPIRANPGAGEYRYVRFAWRKRGEGGALVQLADRGAWQSNASGRGRELCYAGGKFDAGVDAIRVQDELPNDWTVVTRDLFADFGPITVTGLRLACADGELLFDSLQFVRSLDDFERVPR